MRTSGVMIWENKTEGYRKRRRACREGRKVEAEEEMEGHEESQTFDNPSPS